MLLLGIPIPNLTVLSFNLILGNVIVLFNITAILESGKVKSKFWNLSYTYLAEINLVCSFSPNKAASEFWEIKELEPCNKNPLEFLYIWVEPWLVLVGNSPNIIFLAFILKIALASSVAIVQSNSVPLSWLPTINLLSNWFPSPILVPKNIHPLQSESRPACFPIKIQLSFPTVSGAIDTCTDPACVPI